MLYDPSTSDALRKWLVKTLEPICDAEPDALAAYVIALLAHDAPEKEMRSEMVKQLEEFLDTGASDFVEQLFAALRSKSYIPYSAVSPVYSEVPSGAPQDGGIPIPLDGLLTPSIPTSPGRGTKRRLEDDDRDAHGPPKGPRLSTDQHYSRYHNGQRQWEHGRDSYENGDVLEGNGFMGRGRRFQGQQGERPVLPRGVCRDYHIKGYCARGITCKYSHDDIAMAPPQMPFAGPMPLPGAALPFLPMFGGLPFMGMPQQAYDPSEARMDLPQQPQQNGAGEEIYGRSGDLATQQHHPSHEPEDHGADIQMAASDRPRAGSQAGHLRPSRGGNAAYRGRGRGGRGTFHGDHQGFGSESSHHKDNKTLVVEKIPEEHLSLEAVNNWFKKFGTVTNVAVDKAGGKALVSFSTHDEAYSAWRAEEAVFNNRFVKIFWHRPMEGQGGAGTRALQASAPVIASLSTAKPQPTPSTSTAAAPSKVASVPKPSPALTALAVKQQQLEKKIAEQKELMSRLAKATPEEKKEIMARLRKLDEAPSTSSTPVPTASPTPPRASSVPALEDNEKKKKELLDMELELHGKPTTDDSTSQEKPENETTESLQEKLAKLRAEASALGITDTAPPYSGPYRGGYRGRGRARATFRGAMRGGPPRASMKLDLRPKALKVSGISSRDAQVVQTIRDWYQAGGQLTSVDVLDDESVVATFRSRAAAELALAKGSSIPGAGSVKLSWHADSNALSKAPATSSQTAQNEKKTVGHQEDGPPSPRPEDVNEDSGWGNEEDGMGMF